MIIILVLVTWALLGAVIGLYEARRGHWHWLWLLGAMAGPFAIPLYRQIQQNERLARPVPLNAGTERSASGVRVLAGVDGSAASLDAVQQATGLLGSRIGRLTLATVADYEINETVPGPLTPEQPWVNEPKELLAEAAASLHEWLGFEPATVLLSGRPADALQAYAATDDHDVIVVGARGRGLTKRLLGSCASQLTQSSGVPVLVMPAERDGRQTGGRAGTITTGHGA